MTEEQHARYTEMMVKAIAGLEKHGEPAIANDLKVIYADWLLNAWFVDALTKRLSKRNAFFAELFEGLLSEREQLQQEAMTQLDKWIAQETAEN